MDFDQDKKIIATHGSIVKSCNTDRPRYIRPVERQRMRPWLIEHLDKNDIPGLVWQTRRHKVFRIAWKHAANQCFNLQKDTNLFERWAIHTGRHQDSDHKRWKANFRCALNSLPDVVELKEQGIKKGNNAFKVYRFLDDYETKTNKEGKPRKKKEKLDYDYENELKFTEGYYEQNYMEMEASTSKDHQGFGNSQISHLPNQRKIYSTITSGVDLLIEADSKEKLEPISDMDNLQKILATATTPFTAGSDALLLEKISIIQLSQLGEVSKMKLDIQQNDKKRETSGFQYVFLCHWCEKVFPAKVDLLQHFLVIHQDKLLSGEEYGTSRISALADHHVQTLEKEIADLEQKVLNFTRETLQPCLGEVIEDGQVVDQVTNSQSSIPSYVENQALDLTVSNIESVVPKEDDEALDLSMNSTKKDLDMSVLFQKLSNKIKFQPVQPKSVNKHSPSNVGVDYTVKCGTYGLAGSPRTKQQMSLFLKKKEEKIWKNTDVARQHSMEDLVHAKILISLKCAAGEVNDNDYIENNYAESGGSDIDKKAHNKSSDKKHVRKIFYVITESEKEGNKSDIILIDTANIDDKGEHRMKTQELNEVISEDNINKKFRSDADSSKSIVLDKSNVAKLKQGNLYIASDALQNDINNVQDDEELNPSKEDSRLKGNVDYLEGEFYQNNIEELSLKAFKCGICQKAFSVDKELFQHVLTHKTDLLCKICGKRFEQLKQFQIHLRHHVPNVPLEFKCSVCMEYSKNITDLEGHRCDLVEIVNVATDNFMKSYQQVLMEEKDHEEKLNLENDERNKRVVVKEEGNGEMQLQKAAIHCSPLQ